MTAVIALLALLLVSALLCLAARFFFRYTFLRAEKPDPWCDEEGMLKDRAFYERPDRQVRPQISAMSFVNLMNSSL